MTFFRILSLILLSHPLTYTAYAQENSRVTTEATLKQFDGKLISDVAVEGLKRIEKDAVYVKIKSRKGQKITRELIRGDIQELYSMAYFDDIAVQAELDSAGEVKLTFQFRERPAIAEIVFEGNEKMSTDDLREVIKLKQWAILDVNLVREDVALIQKHYEEKGFYLVKVHYEVQKLKEDEIKLIYKINDYEKVRIKKITFLNNHVFTDNQLKSVLAETREGDWLSFLNSSGNFRESSFKQDLQRLTYWYLDHGYIKFRFENPVVTVSDDKQWLYVTIYVDEGLQYSMGEQDFDGDLLFSKEELASEVMLKKGDTFRISQRNADIQRLTEKYQDLGYAFVNVIPKMNVHDDTRTVDINYGFEKGHLVYFGEITVLGNNKTHDKVIRRELRVHEGELYSGSGMRISKERIERLGYFEPGEVIFNTVTPKGKDDILNLEITVKERSTGTITLGAGYGSVQGFFLTTQVAEINLLGRGQTLSFQAQYAADRLSKSFSLGFTDPYAFDTHWSMGFDLFSVVFPIPNKYVMRKLGFDIRFGRALTDDINAYVTYKNEGLTVSQKASPAIDSSLDEGVLSSVVWSVVRDKRNNRFETSDGDYQSVSLETAGIGGNKKFLKWTGNNRYYRRIVGDLVFRNNIEYGQITRFEGYGIPPAERFYLGGPNNLRGYDAFSVGPSLRNEPLGGLVELLAMAELEYPLIREAGLKWVVFYDAGNAFNQFPGFGKEPWVIRTDAGFGLRWFSPIGPLRFEWGFPFRAKPGEPSSSFYFFIGPPF